MQYENNLEKLKAEKPEGATIVAVKGDRVIYFKETEKDRLLTFNRTMWVKTWFTPMHMNLKHFDFISVIQMQNMYQMISLKDQLPPMGEKVLIYRPHAHLSPHKDPNFKIAKYIGEGLWIGSHFEHEITHWLPLIKPQ